MFKRLILWLLREELINLQDEAVELATNRISKSLILSFNTIKERIAAVEDLALKTSDAVDRLETNTNNELDLLSGAHEHLDDIVQGICEELNKDHDVLGALFDEIMERLEDHEERLDELEE